MSSTREPPLILVIEEEEETRYGIKRLLIASGYQVDTAKNEPEAVLRLGLYRPDLVLVSGSLHAMQALPVARQMRQHAGVGAEVPVVFFCVTSLEEGAEIAAGLNIFLIWPDNFDQLRALLNRLLRDSHPPAEMRSPLPAE